MEYNIWKQNYCRINVSVKFIGIWWEFWSYPYLYGLTYNQHFENVKLHCINKFGKKQFKMRLVYPDIVMNIKIGQNDKT